jgi:hypothetical protein
VSEAAKPAACPADGAPAERVFTMPGTSFNRPAPVTPPPRGSDWSHSGHSHGAGVRPHTH